DPGRLQAGIRPGRPRAVSRRRDLARHLSAVGSRHARKARQGPLPARPWRRRGRVPGSVQAPGRGARPRMKLRVLIRLKPGILDVQGAAVQRALAGLGFADASELRVGKLIDVEVDAATAVAARQRVDEMCRKLLANTILEDYTIEAVEAERLAPR